MLLNKKIQKYYHHNNILQMASTGLLGFNPYQQGVAIDISSKPTQLAIQLQQRENAKKDALEKYFMDYEKTLNPQGLSADETKVFLQKFNDNKNFWIKNKEAILNPSKYGYDAQSQYMANIKDQLSYINEGKKATAERKALNDFINKERAKGNDISDNVMEIASQAAKPVGFGYVAPDYSKIQVFKPHNPVDYLKELKSITRTAGKQNITRQGNYDVLTYDEIPDLNEAAQLANSKLQTDMGYKKYISHLAQDPQELSGLGKIYEQRTGNKFNPQSLQDISVAYTLSGLPIKKSNPITRTNLQAQSSAIEGRQRRNEINPYNAVLNIYNSGTTDTTPYDVNGETILGKIITLPPDVESDLFDKIGGRVRRPDKIVMSDDKSKIGFIYNGAASKLNRVINTRNDLIPSLLKSYGGISSSKNYLFSQPQSSPEPTPKPAPIPKPENTNKQNKMIFSEWHKINPKGTFQEYKIYYNAK